MKRKIIGIVAAIVLAAVGTFALVAYVQSAKDEAVAGEERVEVYVVEDRARRHAPRRDQAVGRRWRRCRRRCGPTAPSATSTTSTTASSPPSSSRPASSCSPAAWSTAGARRGRRSEGLQEVTVALDPERAVGGELRAGDTVGVVLSFDPFDARRGPRRSGESERVPGQDTDFRPAPVQAPSGRSPADGQTDDGERRREQKTPNKTHLTFHKVLVTGVQFDRRRERPSVRGRAEDARRRRRGARRPGTAAPAPGDAGPVVAPGRAGRVRRRVRPHLADRRERRRRRERHPGRHPRRGVRREAWQR